MAAIIRNASPSATEIKGHHTERSLFSVCFLFIKVLRHYFSNLLFGAICFAEINPQDRYLVKKGSNTAVSHAVQKHERTRASDISIRCCLLHERCKV